MKNVCLLLAVSLSVYWANAQEEKKKSEIGLSFFLGFNSSGLPSSGETDNQSRQGLHAGAGINIAKLNDNFGLRTEIIYSQQGNKNSYGESYYGGSTVTKLNYLNLPVLARYSTNKGFFAEAGLQPGLLLSAKQKTTSTGNPSGGGSATTNKDIKKELKSFDLGLPLGAGYVFKKKWGISARFSPGLLNLSRKDENNQAVKKTNQVFSARISYAL